MTIICLETDIEKDYSHFLGEFIMETMHDQNPESIATIRSFWDNEYDWEDIQDKTAVEGSTWYVWWMDGVRRYMEKELGGMTEKKDEMCLRCGLPKTRFITQVLDAPDSACAADDTRDSVAIRLCDEHTMTRLALIASTAINTGLLFAVQYGGRASERSMRKYQEELEQITAGMKLRKT